MEELFGGLASAGPLHALLIGWQRVDEKSALSATKGEKKKVQLLLQQNIAMVIIKKESLRCS